MCLLVPCNTAVYFPQNGGKPVPQMPSADIAVRGRPGTVWRPEQLENNKTGHRVQEWVFFFFFFFFYKSELFFFFTRVSFFFFLQEWVFFFFTRMSFFFFFLQGEFFFFFFFFFFFEGLYLQENFIWKTSKLH